LAFSSLVLTTSSLSVRSARSDMWYIMNPNFRPHLALPQVTCRW
jgi:hypothetical protein